MSNEPYSIEEIPLSEIELDRDTQVRVAICEETVQRYYDAMTDEAARDRFPPIDAIRDDNDKLWLCAGHHRVTSAKRRKFKTILGKVRSGTKEDAIWEAIKSNAKNGLPLGKEDIRRAIEMAIVNFPHHSNRRIAEAIGCSEQTVRRYRESHSTAPTGAVETRIGKDGKSRPAKMPKPESVKSAPQEVKTQASTVTMPELPAPVNNAAPEKRDRSDDRRRIEANVKETQILATISQLQTQIAEWFELAPDDMFEGFGKRLRKRIGELID